LTTGRYRKVFAGSVSGRERRSDVSHVYSPCSEPQHCALLRMRTRRADWRLVSGVQKVESRVDRARVRPILGRPAAEPGRLHPESVVRALARAACFAARVGFCAVSFGNFDFSRDFAGCSSPVLSVPKPWFPQGFSHIGPVPLAFLPIHACPCLQVLRRLVRCLAPW
jgi:hypothetical protein